MYFSMFSQQGWVPMILSQKLFWFRVPNPPWEHHRGILAWLLIRAVGVSDSQLIQLLQPFGGALPAGEQQFSELTNSIRRMGRIIEQAPGNLSTMLRGRQHPMHQYHVQDHNPWNENEVPSQYDHPSSSWQSPW